MADFLYNVPRSVLLHLVRKADRKAGYDDTEVRVSLLLDVDKGDVKSQREYVRLWGQSHKWIRYRWDDIWQDVTRWATSEGRQLDGPGAANLPPEWLAWAVENLGHTKGTAGAQKTPETNGVPRSGAQQGHTKGTHTIHPSSPSEEPTASPRAEGFDFDPVGYFHETYAAIPEAHPWHRYRLGIMQEPRVRAEVADADAWREAVRIWTEREYNPRSLDSILDRYRTIRDAAEPIPGADAGDEGAAGSQVPAHRPTPNGAAAGAVRGGGRARGLRGTPEHRKTASDRRSEYGFDDASRDVDAALADLIAADEDRRDAARRGAADGGGRDDG